MKNKYERMTKEEKKEVYKEYKIVKKELSKKMKRMLLICNLGIIYFILSIVVDSILLKKVSVVLDIILLILFICILIKTRRTKIELLNKYVIEKDKELKKDIVKKHKK